MKYLIMTHSGICIEVTYSQEEANDYLILGYDVESIPV